MMKITKGQFGYIARQKKKVTLITVGMFTLSLATFLFGYFITKPHSNANLFTLIAVLGMLPASKSAVSMIMYLKTKNASADIYEQTLLHIGELDAVYELLLTSYDKNFQISSLIVKGSDVCGYTESPKCDTSAAEKHISKILSQNGYKMSVKIFSDFPKYLARLDHLNGSSQENSSLQESFCKEQEEQTAKVLRVILAISI